MKSALPVIRAPMKYADSVATTSLCNKGEAVFACVNTARRKGLFIDNVFDADGARLREGDLAIRGPLESRRYRRLDDSRGLVGVRQVRQPGLEVSETARRSKSPGSTLGHSSLQLGWIGDDIITFRNWT